MNLNNLINVPIKWDKIISACLLILVFTFSPAYGANLGGTLSEDMILSAEESPYILEYDLIISSGITLTVPAGVVVKSSGPGIYVSGTLNASNAAFTSLKDDNTGGDTNADQTSTTPEPGDWAGIFYESTSKGTLAGCLIQYGKYFDGYFGQVIILSDNVTIINCNIKYGSSSGIIIKNASPEISANTITDHIYISPSNSGGHGIFMLNSASSVTGNTISNNNDAGLYINESPNAKITENKVYNNGKGGDWYYKGIYLSADSVNAEISKNAGTDMLYLSNDATLTQERTWDSFHPWVFGWMTIGPTGKLTVSNAIVKFSGYIKVDGELNAAGSLFTSIIDDTGGDSNGDGNASVPAPVDGKGIVFTANSSGLFDGTAVRYGSYTDLFNGLTYPGQLSILSDNVEIKNSIIQDSNRAGIYVQGVTPILSRNQIINNKWGVYTEQASFALHDHIFNDNSEYAIFNESANKSIDAIDNFWGDMSGPEHETANPDGTGDRVSDYVVFEPFTGSVTDDYLYSLRHAIKGLQIVAGINAPGYIIDMTNDGKTGLEDVILILRKVAGLN